MSSDIDTESSLQSRIEKLHILFLLFIFSLGGVAFLINLHDNKPVILWFFIMLGFSMFRKFLKFFLAVQFIMACFVVIAVQKSTERVSHGASKKATDSLHEAHIVPNERTFYKLYKNEKPVGYLLGSIHANFNPLDIRTFHTTLSPYVADVDSLYLEAQLPHYSKLALGIERTVLELAEQSNPIKKIEHFEESSFQHAMLASSVWVGAKIVTLPWFDYKTLQAHPTMTLLLSRLVCGYLPYWNTLYNMATSQSVEQSMQTFSLQQQALLTEIFDAYMNNEAKALPNEDNERCLMKERDAAFVEKIIANINQHPDQKTLYVVGVAHLPRPDGVVNLLKQQDIMLEPIDFVKRINRTD